MNKYLKSESGTLFNLASLAVMFVFVVPVVLIAGGILGVAAHYWHNTTVWHNSVFQFFISVMSVVLGTAITLGITALMIRIKHCRK